MSSTRRCMNQFDRFVEKMDECRSKFKEDAARDYELYRPFSVVDTYSGEDLTLHPVVNCNLELQKITKNLDFCLSDSVYEARRNQRNGM